ncbi:MAG TPA: type II toxin-antitoxin system prevent-host-death family antitoxin [Streptosporangiaceae bacterium]
MAMVPARELRNNTAGVIRRMQAGEEIVLTVNGKPVGQLVPLPESQQRPISRAEFVRRMRYAQADPGLRDDLAHLAGETTDDAPIE